MNTQEMMSHFGVVLIAAGLCVASTSAFGGDFSNPTPYSLDANRALSSASESARMQSAESGSVLFYTLGDYYERYQSGTNWNNAVLSGNTIILNGDNNSVTLTTDGSTITQTSDGTCQNTSNTLLTDGSTADATTINCDTSQ